MRGNRLRSKLAASMPCRSLQTFSSARVSLRTASPFLGGFVALLGLFACSDPTAGAPSEADVNAGEPTARTEEQPLSTGIRFAFEGSDPNLVPGVWEYREVAARNWIGCQSYDVLQGMGWYPTTWYRSISPILEGGKYMYSIDRTFRAVYCGARMDAYNALGLRFPDPAAPGGYLVGYVAVIPDGNSADVAVRCRKDTSRGALNTLWCDEAHVKVPSKGTVAVRLDWSL